MCAQLTARKLSPESKVHSLNVHMCIKEHVCWLQLPVEVPLWWQSAQRVLASGKCRRPDSGWGAMILQVMDHVPSLHYSAP